MALGHYGAAPDDRPFRESRGRPAYSGIGPHIRQPGDLASFRVSSEAT